MDFPEWYQKYDADGELLEEPFEVESVAAGGVLDLMEKAEDKLILRVESEGACSEEEFSDISSALAGVSVEGEEGMELLDAL